MPYICRMNTTISKLPVNKNGSKSDLKPYLKPYGITMTQLTDKFGYKSVQSLSGSSIKDEFYAALIWLIVQIESKTPKKDV